MTDPEVALAQLVRAALAAEFGADYADADPVIRPSQFADFQANVALPLAKRLGLPPRDVAARLASHLHGSEVCQQAEVSGPGFINLTLRDDWIAAQASGQLADPRLGVAAADPVKKMVVDYSGPNVAKELHVGHLRATVVGDAIVRVLEHLGHEVTRAAHLGDWGTQFGMLIEHALDIGAEATYAELADGEFTPFYQAARVKFDSDPAFADRSRRRVVQLQAGDERTLQLWQLLVGDSMEYLRKIYRRLQVTLTDEYMAPESFYNPMLADVCAELEASGVAVISDGALCAFPPGFTGRDGRPLPLMLRKSDGGYGYDSTDLAAIRYRLRDLGVTRIIYVVGSEQHQHLLMVFAVARQAGWLTDAASAEHAQIGLVTAPGGQRLRTRSGEQAKLITLIDEAVARADKVIEDRYDDPSRAQPDRRGGRDRRAEVRRPVGSPRLELRARLRPDAGADRQHRAIPAVRDGADPVDLPPGRARARSCHRPDPAGPADGTGACAAPAGPGRGRHRSGRRGRTAPARGLPVRDGQRVHRVLRAVPGAEGRGRADPCQQAGLVGADAARAADRAGTARHPGSRPDVTRAGLNRPGLTRPA